MAQQEPIRVQIEGLEDLRALVREMRRAAEEMQIAGRATQDAANYIKTSVATSAKAKR